SRDWSSDVCSSDLFGRGSGLSAPGTGSPEAGPACRSRRESSTRPVPRPSSTVRIAAVQRGGSVVPEKVRNVVLVGRGRSGKTTLGEAMLFAAGASTRSGSVGNGTSVLDHEPEEVARTTSLSLDTATVEWLDHRINIIDSPGSPDFVGDARAAIRAADMALFCVSAVDGVEVHTEQLWRVAEEEGIPRAIVITKLDRERADYS